MSDQHLCIAIRFVQPFPLFHGRGDADAPEWPPSPMRAFQALVNAAYSSSLGKPLAAEVRAALQVLEQCRPEIVAPPATLSTVGYRAYVPHNQYDLVLAALHRGMESSTEAFRKLNGSVRVEKDFRPMRVECSGQELPAIYYLYPLDATTLGPQEILHAIRPSARAMTHLGWGIDQVAGDAMLTDRFSPQLSGERWIPSIETGQWLRVPRKGALEALTKRHGEFLKRLQDGWTPVAPLGDDDIEHVPYRRDTDPPARPHAVFKLLDDNEDAYRYPHTKLIHIAGMVRHLAIKAMETDPPPWIENPANWLNHAVRGKRDESDGDDHKQFSYIPLPSIGHPHADAMVRNVMLVAPLGMERELNYLAERLDGLTLVPKEPAQPGEKNRTPILSGPVELERFDPPRGKFIAKCYLGSSSAWETVTPVILDGRNRGSPSEKPKEVARVTQRLIRKALQRAGVETPCEFTWQSLPFWNNTLSAHKYDRQGNRVGYFRPSYLDGRSAVHVRLMFENPVPGPLAIGAGRHCGLGTLAAVTDL